MLFKQKWNYALVAIFSVSLVLFSYEARANMGMYAGGYAGMWGTGYWGGTQACNYPWQQGSGAVDIADEVTEEYNAIQSLKAELAKAKLEKKRADQEMEFAGRKLERVFDGEVYEFLIDVHIGKLNQCSDYKAASPGSQQSVGSVSCSVVDPNGNVVISNDSGICGGKDDIPGRLAGKWLGPNGYCTATSYAKGGDVSSKICNDVSLRPEDAPKARSYSTSECSKSLSNYKKHKLLSDKSQEKIENLEDEIRERQYAIADAKERAKIERQYAQENTSESYCPGCIAANRGYSYSKPKTDWASVIGQVGVGLGLGFLGAKYDQANMEYQAQLGYPPQQGYPTAVSMGLPFVLSGVYGAINGTSGQGGFGCASGMYGTGYPYGVQGGMNGPFGGAGGVYGPYASGGVFGYPQGMYGSPWGGGMYLPGYGAGGMIAGPWGGFPGGGVNAGFAINGGLNGLGMAMPGMANCFMPPCPGGIGMMSPGMGYMMSGGIGMMANGGMMGYPGYMMGSMGTGYMMNGGIGMMANGGMMGYPGYMMGGMPGYMMSGGIGMMSNGGMMGYPGYMMGSMGTGMVSGGTPMSGYMMSGGLGMMGVDQAQMQYYQQMMQMQQQQMQQAMQYQQMQMQAQMEAYQRQMAVTQQAGQISQEIMSLQMRLQMLYYGGYSYSSGTTTLPGTTYPSGSMMGPPPLIGSPMPTVPGTTVPTTVPTVPNGR